MAEGVGELPDDGGGDGSAQHSRGIEAGDPTGAAVALEEAGDEPEGEQFEQGLQQANVDEAVGNGLPQGAVEEKLGNEGALRGCRQRRGLRRKAQDQQEKVRREVQQYEAARGPGEPGKPKGHGPDPGHR